MEKDELMVYLERIARSEVVEAPEGGLALLAWQIRQALPPIKPSPSFQEALWSRLRSQQPHLRASWGPALRPTLLGTAALSVASLAYLLWRSRHWPTLSNSTKGI